MMDYVFAVGIIVSVILVMIGVQYIKAKGYVNADHIEQAIDALSVAERLINMLNLKEDVKTNVNMVLDTADSVADYVHKIMGAASVEDKAELANEVVELLIYKLKIEISDEEKDLAKIVVDASLSYLNGKV